jgi:hypothetical protein
LLPPAQAAGQSPTRDEARKMGNGVRQPIPTKEVQQGKGNANNFRSQYKQIYIAIKKVQIFKANNNCYHI